MGRTSQTCHDSMRRNSSARAASTRFRGRALPVMSPRYGVGPSDPATTAQPRVVSPFRALRS
eukprot:9953559-Alexandrium_andersonii.AAC.1